MASQGDFNSLYYYLHSFNPQDNAIIGGSATPYLSLKELIALSSDPEATRSALSLENIPFALSSPQGNAKLRETIADLYDHGTVSSADVIVANGTSGCNHIVHQSLLRPGDHVICQYPIYGPCIEEPLAIGCDVSYLRMDPDNGWCLDLEQLKELIRPGKTKLLMLNNPNNPTGTHITSQLQREIIKLAKQHDIVVHSDEIFRPLFHDEGETPKSFIEHPDLNYDKVVVTSSLSKAYGGSGIRIGWIGTHSAQLRRTFLSYRVMSCHSVSVIDEAIATELLSPRCRPAILAKHLAIAKTNIALVQDLVDTHPDQCEWVKPYSGAVGFIKFKHPHTGEVVDDVDFCRRLQESKKVVLGPATSCFEFGDPKHTLKGRCRVHFTTKPENVRKGIQLLGEFLDEEKAGKADGAVQGTIKQMDGLAVGA